MEQFLTTGQAAEFLGVSKPTVVRAVQRGLLQPALVTPGLHRRFRRADLEAFRRAVLAHIPAAEVDIEVSGRAATPAPSLTEAHTLG